VERNYEKCHRSRRKEKADVSEGSKQMSYSHGSLGFCHDHLRILQHVGVPWAFCSPQKRVDFESKRSKELAFTEKMLQLIRRYFESSNFVLSGFFCQRKHGVTMG
jgi:hypothetical protein